MIGPSLARTLREGGVAIGTVTSLGSPAVAGLLAGLGFDWILVDVQHGTWERTSAALGLLAVRSGGSVPLARPPRNDFASIGWLLDEGALGVVVPMVESREDAERVAEASRYAPRGSRSIGLAGAAAYGPDYGEWIDDEVVVAVQIETRTGVDNADKILGVDGIEGCWIGPSDLAVSLGDPMGSAAHDDAVLRVVEACRSHGKWSGIAASDADHAARWIAAGCQFVSVGVDRAHLHNGARRELHNLRDVVGGA